MSRQVPHAEDTATGTPTAGLVPISAGPGLAPAWGAAGGGTKVLPFVITAGGAVIPDGNYDLYVPNGLTITDWIAVGDQVGNASIGVLTASYAAYPTFTDITGGSPIVLSGVIKNRMSSLAGWTPVIPAARFVRYDVSGVVSITRLGIFLVGS